MTEPFSYADRIKETTTTTGSGGVYSLGGAVTGYKTFASQLDASRVYYFIQDVDGNWEKGIGLVASGTPDTLTREVVEDSSNAGFAVNWTAGTKEIWCGLSSQSVPDGRHAQYLQASTGFFYGETSNNTPANLAVVDETVTPFGMLSVVTALVTAQDYATLAKGWELKALFGPSGMIGTLTKTVIGASAGASGWDVDMDVDVDGALQITVTGDPSIAVTWAASVRYGSTRNN